MEISSRSDPGPVLSAGAHRWRLARRVLVMGILNRTRDSFYDRGAHFSLDALLRRSEQLVADGADILDVGARPGGVGVRHVSPDEEAELVAETLRALHRRFPVALSVDTTRASVLEVAVAEGAVIGNDMSGFRDPAYLEVAARSGIAVVATHHRLGPGIPDPDPRYADVVGEIREALLELRARVRAAGIGDDRLIVDPGFDLGKTWQQSVQLLARFGAFATLGAPALLAVSNKIFLGRLLNLDTGARGHASVAACALGVDRGARIVRAHDVLGAVQAARLAAALQDNR